MSSGLSPSASIRNPCRSASSSAARPTVCRTAAPRRSCWWYTTLAADLRSEILPRRTRGGAKDGDQLDLALDEDRRQCLELTRALGHRIDGLRIADHAARLALLISLGGSLHQPRREVDLGPCERVLAPLFVASLAAEDAACRDACKAVVVVVVVECESCST
eukprot:scaffold8291_cov64-Phaeocystis_antarctica.AAC.7